MKLGDIIYYFTKYTGIKFLVDFFIKIFQKDCGYEKRREKLNKK